MSRHAHRSAVDYCIAAEYEETPLGLPLRALACITPIDDDAIIRRQILHLLVGGESIAKGSEIMGEIKPRQRRRRISIFAGADVRRLRRRILAQEVDLDIILLAARLGKRPTAAQIAALAKGDEA